MQIEQQQINNQQNFLGIEKENEDNQIEHKTLNHNSLYYTFMQRYFVTYQNQTQYLHIHSNGICLISLKREVMPSAPKQISEFIQISQVKGKKKKGGVKVRPETIIAKVICQDGTQVKVLALIQGTILEKKQDLTVDLIGKPQGFFIIILPSKKVTPQKIGMKRIAIDHQGQ